MRGGECLVEIQVHDVESHITRTYNPQERIHIGSVVVQKASASVNKFRNLSDFLFEKTERIRIGHHDAGDIVTEKRSQVSHVHEAVFLGLHDYHFQAADCRTGRIGSVCTVRNDDLGPAQISPADMVLTHDHQTCKFTVCACARIERERRHSGNRRQVFLHIVIYLQRSLY